VAETNDGASDVEILDYCKLIFNDGECNDDEFCCKKRYDLRAHSLAEREKNLDKACSIVMNGGFVTVGVKAGANKDGSGYWFLGHGPKAARQQGISKVAESAGATGHCEVIALTHTHT